MRSVLGWVGRVLLVTGILLLLFVAYQLWGTGIYTARAQSKLRDEFAQTLKNAKAGTSTSTTTTSPDPATTDPDSPTVVLPTTTLAPAPPPPGEGDAIGYIKIPKIGLGTDTPMVVVEGVGVSDLEKGPGHYPGTPFPGQEGNVAIAGHRTTYLHPFGDVDQLSAGDEITLTTVQGTFTYRITRDPFPVSPDSVSVLNPTPDPSRPGHYLATLTLTTCNPKYSAAQRLIVQAELELPVGAVPLPPAPGTNTGTPTKISGLSGDSSSRLPAFVWGLIVAFIGGLWWFLFHRYKHWYVWIAGVIPFLLVLFFFYTYVERLLPANY
jgi:sortase A